MKIKNKSIFVFVCLVMIICFAGCSKSIINDETNTTTTSEVSTTAEETSSETEAVTTDFEYTLGAPSGETVSYSSNNYTIELDLGIISGFMTYSENSNGIFRFRGSDGSESMFVRADFSSDYESRDAYFDGIREQYNNTEMVVEPTEYEITVNGQSDYLINYFYKGSHSSGNWDYYYKINDEMALIINAYGCNEGIPGKLGLAEELIDCIVTNSVITKD